MFFYFSDAEAFLTLMNRDWKDYITTVALTSLETAKYNKVNLLPHTEDLVKLDTFLRSEIAECLEQYDDEDLRPILDDVWFRRICRATCAYATIFNKRRGNECCKIHKSSYVNRPDWKKGANTEIVTSLSLPEKQMMEK